MASRSVRAAEPGGGAERAARPAPRAGRARAGAAAEGAVHCECTARILIHFIIAGFLVNKRHDVGKIVNKCR